MSLQDILNKRENYDYLNMDITSQEFEENCGCRILVRTPLSEVPQTKLNTFYLLRSKFDEQKQYWKPKFMIQVVGLRRSGKTIALQQLYTEEYSNSAIIIGIKNTDISLVSICRKLIDEFKVQNIFIDEITYFKRHRIDETMRHLFTVFVESGRTQFIVTGTESIAIAESNKNYMYGRTELIKFSPTLYSDFGVIESSSFVKFFKSEVGYETDTVEISLLDSLTSSLQGYFNDSIENSIIIDDVEVDGNKLYILFMIYFSIIDFSDKTRYKYVFEIFKRLLGKEIKKEFSDAWIDEMNSKNFRIREMFSLIGVNINLSTYRNPFCIRRLGIADPRIINILFRFLREFGIDKVDLKSYKGIAFESVVQGQVMAIFKNLCARKFLDCNKFDIEKIKLGNREADLCVLDRSSKRVVLVELKVHTLVENKYLCNQVDLEEYLDYRVDDGNLENYSIRRLYVHCNSNESRNIFYNCGVMHIDKFLIFIKNWFLNIED